MKNQNSIMPEKLRGIYFIDPEDKEVKETIKHARKKLEIPLETFNFASLTDICHLKNAESETKHQKYKCRVVLRGDIVKKRFGI